MKGRDGEAPKNLWGGHVRTTPISCIYLGSSKISQCTNHLSNLSCLLSWVLSGKSLTSDKASRIIGCGCLGGLFQWLFPLIWTCDDCDDGLQNPAKTLMATILDFMLIDKRLSVP